MTSTKDRKIAARTALIRLSAWAADFKVGIIGDDSVVNVMRAIVNGFEGLSEVEREVLLEEALEDWGISYQLYLTLEDENV